MIARYQNAFTLFILLLADAMLFNCGGKGGGDKRDHLRKEYQRDPDGYRKRWGV